MQLPQPRLKPGRPRDGRLDDRLLAAARATFLERGYGRASLSEIARRAGLGTPAIYRRWRTKADVAIDVIEHASQPSPIPDTGSFRDDLAVFLRQRIRIFSTRLFHHVILPVVLEASGDERLTERIRKRFVDYREPWMKARVGKAIKQGELRRDTDPSRLIDLLMGTITMPLLFAQDLPKEADAPKIVDYVLRGFEPR